MLLYLKFLKANHDSSTVSVRHIACQLPQVIPAVRAKKQLRHVLQQNKDLACALEAARARILQLESGKERHDKVYGLCLPQIKAWTEDNVKQVHTILENSLRSIRLVADILTPSQDLTLAEDGDDTGQELLQRSLHPPGSRLVGCPDLMDVEEEEEEGETDGAEDGAAQETQIPLSSKGSVCLPDEEADERISVAGRATTASPLRELDVNEYTMIFGSRPKIARTPERGGSPSRRPEPLPPPRIRMFDCQSSSKQTTSKVPASPPLPKDAPEPVRPAKPSLACRRSSRVQKLPGGTGESGWADDVDAVKVVPPTRRSCRKGSTAHRASLPSKNRLTFVVLNQVPAGSRRSSSGRPTVPPVETPPADSPPAATGRGASRRSSVAGISRKAQQEEQQRGKRDLEDPELLQSATPSPVRSSSQGARLEGAGEVEWVDEAPEDGPLTRSLERSAAGKAPKSCRSTFFLPKPRLGVFGRTKGDAGGSAR
ncbi:hypothetical protein IscW_ISCW006804 [Ixodes scapularis]|uniref:Uncharacterized protein n=1 Tax=Ixodes scapularis TaxID=6945 RepID=B7PM46_IXOSC|nr:hypothetical protein IscW_ISCW006804 [Ixodes scapularis]|eukprot:XP_002434844.1 hypothetical protein IscW_ISCW006804 [Ixodes scapularis]